jgi:hypothetical protein
MVLLSEEQDFCVIMYECVRQMRKVWIKFNKILELEDKVNLPNKFFISVNFVGKVFNNDTKSFGTSWPFDDKLLSQVICSTLEVVSGSILLEFGIVDVSKH